MPDGAYPKSSFCWYCQVAEGIGLHGRSEIGDNSIPVKSLRLLQSERIFSQSFSK